MTALLVSLALLGQVAGMDIYDPAEGAFLDGPGVADSLFAAADSAYRVGDYGLSASLYLRGLSLDPSSASAIYNLACCYGLLGEEQLAATYLRRAWEGGFEDLEHISWDPDFDAVREGAVFSRMLDSLAAAVEAEMAGAADELFFHAEGPFRCLVRTPEGWDGESELPLVLGIHGLGDTPEGFMGLWEVVGQWDCMFAVPQAPSPFLVGDRIGYTWFYSWDEGGSESALLSRDYVLTLLDRLEEEYPVSGVLLFGYSQGGGMTYMVGLHEPERFTALAPFSGWLDSSVITGEEIAAASGVPVRITHGEQDGMVEYDAALAADSMLSEAGYDVELTTFQGKHSFSRDGLEAFLAEFLGEV